MKGLHFDFLNMPIFHDIMMSEITHSLREQMQQIEKKTKKKNTSFNDGKMDLHFI